MYKDLADGSQFFILNRGFSMWSNDSAYLGWYWQSEKHVKNRHEGFLSFLGEKDLKNSDLDLTVCLVHLYLDKNAQFINRLSKVAELLSEIFDDYTFDMYDEDGEREDGEVFVSVEKAVEWWKHFFDN